MQLSDSLVPVALYPFAVLITIAILIRVCKRHNLTSHIPVAAGWTLAASAFVVAAMAVPHEYLSVLFWLALVAVCMMDVIALWRLTVHAAQRHLASRLVRQQDADAS